MGYPLDPAAQNAVLDAILSRDVSGLPTSFEVALLNAHPLLGGVELTSDGGYARAIIAADLTDFPAASGGSKVSISLPYGTSTAAYSDTATHYLLIDAGDSTTRYFAGRLLEEIVVDAAGTVVAAQLAAFWNTQSL